MYLVDDYWCKQGVCEKFDILFIIFGSVIFGVELFKFIFMKVVDCKGLQLCFFYWIRKIDGENKWVYFDIVKEYDKIFVVCYNYCDIEKEEIVEGSVMMEFDMFYFVLLQVVFDFIQ